MNILFLLISFFLIIFLLLLWKKKSRSVVKKQKTDDSSFKLSFFLLNLNIVSNLQEFTLKELENYDGIKNNLIYLGCKNFVFDVTNSGF